jgi:anaerobic selenocysteine-containing dehydrogenase
MDCPDACSLLVSSDENGGTILKGNPHHPITAGFICAKIKRHITRLAHSDRILYPMLRTDGGWQRIGWDDALDLCARKIQQLRDEPKAILHIHGSGAKGVLKEATALLFNTLGTSRTWGSLCDAAGYMACIRDFGSRNNNRIQDLLNASKIVNWGRDLSRSSMHTAALVRKARKRGAKVLTISPGGDGNHSFSDETVRITPGTDRFLAAAVIRRFIESDLISPDILILAKRASKFLALILKHSLTRLSKACDVSLDRIERLFQFYASERPVATLVGTGVQRYAYGGENVRFINALTMLSGHLGISGGGSYYQLHSYRNLDLSWIEPKKKIPRRSFSLAAIGNEIHGAQNPPVKMIWINGMNTVNQAPDSRSIIQAFRQVDFKVVVDAFFNDTAQRADLVLPAKLMLEQEDLVGSFLHEYVHYVPALLEAPGEARDDYWIISEVARRLEPPLMLPEKDSCLRAALDSPHLSVSLEQLRKQKYVCAERPAIAYAGPQFDHRDGKYRFPSILHEEPPPPQGFPLRLLTLVRREAMHSQMVPEQQTQPPEVRIAPDSPVWEKLDIDRDVYLVSLLGRLKVTLKALPGLHPQTVLYRRGDWMSLGGGANQLIEAKQTDMGPGAAYYSQYVNLTN